MAVVIGAKMMNHKTMKHILLMIVSLSVGSAACAGEAMSTVSGCRVYLPPSGLSDSLIWTGACVNGFAHGPGALVWEQDGFDGRIKTTYSGTMNSGRMTGYFEVIYPAGSRYAGEYINGVRNGYGVYEYADEGVKAGEKYEGHWLAGRMHGSGTYYFQDGGTFQGNWFDGAAKEGICEFDGEAKPCRQNAEGEWEFQGTE